MPKITIDQDQVSELVKQELVSYLDHVERQLDLHETRGNNAQRIASLYFVLGDYMTPSRSAPSSQLASPDLPAQGEAEPEHAPRPNPHALLAFDATGLPPTCVLVGHGQQGSLCRAVSKVL